MYQVYSDDLYKVVVLSQNDISSVMVGQMGHHFLFTTQFSKSFTVETIFFCTSSANCANSMVD